MLLPTVKREMMMGDRFHPLCGAVRAAEVLVDAGDAGLGAEMTILCDTHMLQARATAREGRNRYMYTWYIYFVCIYRSDVYGYLAHVQDHIQQYAPVWRGSIPYSNGCR